MSAVLHIAEIAAGPTALFLLAVFVWRLSRSA